jgi:hypothetical protein
VTCRPGRAASRLCVRRVLIVACVSLVGASASPAGAQERRGLWFSIGTGVARVAVDSTPADGDLPLRTHGPALHLSAELGWTVNPRLLVGLDVKMAAWTVEPIDETGYAGHVGVTVLYYRTPRSHLFFKGGIGGSAGELGFTIEGEETRMGVAAIGGVGYDLMRGRRFSFTPSVNYWYGHIGGTQRFTTGTVRDWRHHAVDVTMAWKLN